MTNTKPRFESSGLTPPTKAALDSAYVWDEEQQTLLRRRDHGKAGWRNNERGRPLVTFGGVIYHQATLLDIMGIPNEPYVCAKSGPKKGGSGGVPRGPRSAYRPRNEPKERAPLKQWPAPVNSIFNMGQS
jgi:hypothetical protein